MAQIIRSLPAVSPAPADFDVPNAVDWSVQIVSATYDGTGAAGAFLPAVQIVAPGGAVAFTFADPSVSVAAGGSAEVTFGPFLKTAGGGGGGSGIQFGVNNVGNFLHVTTNVAAGNELAFTDSTATGILQIGNGIAQLDGTQVTVTGSSFATFQGSTTCNLEGQTINIGHSGVGPGHTNITTKNDGGTGQIGFFGATPVDRPATPVTLADVITALQSLGLVT